MDFAPVNHLVTVVYAGVSTPSGREAEKSRNTRAAKVAVIACKRVIL